MTFHVGQKVVSLGDFASEAAKYGMVGPPKGAICTIREFEYRSGPAIRLREFVNPVVRCEDGIIGEISFCLTRFRPLTETKSSQSFTTGAPKDSERWDNRRKVRERAQ